MTDKILNIKVQTKGAKQSKKALGGVDKSLKSVGKQAIAAGAAFFGGRAIIAGLQKSIELSAKMQGVQRGFDNLVKSAGFSTQAFGKLQKATDGTMKSMDLMTQANNAMLLGIAESEDQMAEMFDVAQRLASALGKDATFGVESLVTGLGRQSKLMLDNLGIMVDTNKLYKDYATSIGVSVEQLSDQEKKQAFVSGAMESAKELVASLGDEQLTTADKIAQASVALDEMTREIGDALAPVVETMTKAFVAFANALDEETIKSYTVGIGAVTAAIVAYNVQMVAAKLRTMQFQVTLAKTGWGALIVGAGLVVGKIMELSGVFGTVSGEAEKLNKQLKKLSQRKFLLLSGVEQVKKIKETKKELETMYKAGEKGSKEFDSFLDSTSKLIETLGLTASESETLFTTAVKAGVAERIGARAEETAAIILSEEEKANIRQDFRDRNREISLDSFEQQRIEIDDMTEKFKQAGIEQIEIDKFTSAAKKRINKAETQFKLKSVSTLMGSLGGLNSAVKGSALVSARLAQSAAIIDMWAGATKAFGQGGVFGFVGAAAIVAAGLANIANIESELKEMTAVKPIEAATGFDGIVDKPTMFLTGEAGAERVSVTPLEGVNAGGGQGSPVNITFNSPVMDSDYTEQTIIPQIKEAIRRGADLGVS